MMSMMRKTFGAFVVTVLAVVLVVAATDFDALGRAVTDELVAGAFDKVVARFDAPMTTALPADKLKTVWSAIIAQFGPFKSITASKVSDEPGRADRRVVDLTIAFEKAPLEERIVFDEDGKIAGLSYRPVLAAAPAR
jgi:hypothetical protein